MYLHTKYEIPTSKNIGDTHVCTGHEAGWIEGRTEGRTVRLVYASLSYFGGIKMLAEFDPLWQNFLDPCMTSEFEYYQVTNSEA